VRIKVLGGFEVTVDRAVVPESQWSSRRAAELVQLLALAEGHRLLRDQVIETLWPHLDADAGAANLRKAAHLARQAVADAGAVVLRRGEVFLFPDRAVVVDAVEFERTASVALADGEPSACAAAADAYGGELLPAAVYEDWTSAPRARLAARHLDCLRAAGRWAAVATADPLDEEAHQKVIQDAIAAGGRAEAIRWYGRLRTALATELGVRPSPATESLYDECVAQLAPPAPPIVGRSFELATATALLDPDRTGAVAGVMLRGPAGIGKSALCAAFAAEARARGASVVPVECRDAFGPYGPIRAAVESLLIDHGVPEDLAPHTRAVLAALTPTAGPAAPTEGPLSRHQVIGALRRLLLAATDGRPVAVIADDMHDADDATVEALLHLASPRDPIVLVLAARQNASLDRQLGRLVRAHRLSIVEVEALDERDAAEVAVAAAGRPLDDATLGAIARLAGGNPFATIELAQMPGLGAGGRLPADVARAITDRLVDLSDDEVALLTRLAIAGEEVDPAVVPVLLGDDEHTAFALLNRALDAGVLRVTGERYRFRHDLVRRALVDLVPPHQRVAVHRDLARRLTAAGARPADVGRHWLAGGRPVDAVDPLLAVAGEALQLGAFVDALGALNHVLAVVPDHALALRLRAEALDAQGDVGTVPAYDAAIACAPAHNADDLRAKRALAQLKQGDVTGAVRSLEGVHPTAVDARLAEALTFSGAAALGFIDPSVGTAKSADCRRLALETGDASAIVVASWAQAAAAHARGELRDSILADLRDTHDLPHLATRVFDGQLCVTQRLLYGARPYNDVIAFADALAAEATRLGAARGHAFGVILRGEAELLSGRLDEAEGDLLDAVRLHRAIGGATGEAHALQRLAELAWYRDDTARAHALLDEALDLARATDMGFHLLDRIFGTRLALVHSTDDVLLALDEAEDDVRGALETCPGCRITFAVPAAVAAARGGDLDRATEYAGTVEFLASVVMRLPAWTAAHHEVLANIARARGDDETAQREFDAAANGYAAAGHPLDRARCVAARDSRG